MGFITRSSSTVQTNEVYDSYNRTLNSADETNLSGIGNISIGINQNPAEIGTGNAIVETVKAFNPVVAAVIVGVLVLWFLNRK